MSRPAPRVASCQFFLLDRFFVFFTRIRVLATMQAKFGSVLYRGHFFVSRPPVTRIQFPDTEGVSGAIEHALTAPQGEMTLEEYERIRDDQFVAVELGGRIWADVGRMALYLSVSEYDDRLTVTHIPWRRGAFAGKVLWEAERPIRSSRMEAIRGIAVAVQEQFPPRGHEFDPVQGLVPEQRKQRQSWKNATFRPRRSGAASPSKRR